MKISKAEIAAIIDASCRTFIPLHQLVLSKDYQARPAGSTSRLSIEELAASIQACGVLQNLIVIKGARNLYEVCAGGRRLQALGLLVSAGTLPENVPVPVLVVAAEHGLIASLSENAFHVPMHPADEFEAFAKLLAQGRSLEDVAAAFGVTPLVVKRRMRLAAVSPKLIAEFRQGRISMDCLMALASVDDHARQEQAWEGLDAWSRQPDHLRRVLSQGEVESDRSPVAKYVGVKAYEKAGGPSRRDLFSDNDKKVYLLDAVLLDQLAVAKLQRKARQILAEGWKWVEVRARFVHDEYARHAELRKSRRPANDTEAAELAVLEGRLAVLTRKLQALDGFEGNELEEGGGEQAEQAQQADQDDKSDKNDDALPGEGDDEQLEVDLQGDLQGDVEADLEADLESEFDAASAAIAALHESLSVWQTELMAFAGCVVYVDADASPAVRYGLIRPEDRNELARAAQAVRASRLAAGDQGCGSDGAHDSHDSHDPHGGHDDGLDFDDADAFGTSSESVPKVRPVHSERLTRNLTAHRVAAIQAELLDRPEVALATLTAQLAGKLLLDGYQDVHTSGDPLTFSATDTHGPLSSDAPDIVSSPAWLAVEAQRQFWRDQLPAEAQALLPWMLAQDAATVTKLLTFLVASSVSGVYAAEPESLRCQRTEGLAQALALDMRKWWQASAASYFNHVSKARIAQVVDEVLGAQAAAPLQQLKKEAAAAGAQQVLASTGWLPQVLRVTPMMSPAGGAMGGAA
nr:ParB/RepB/Spo0J family partition protein [uncultured Roseateles sp.]